MSSHTVRALMRERETDRESVGDRVSGRRPCSLRLQKGGMNDLVIKGKATGVDIQAKVELPVCVL